LLLEGGPGSPSCLLGGKHSVSWGFEDMLPTPDNSAGGAESKGKILSKNPQKMQLSLLAVMNYVLFSSLQIERSGHVILPLIILPCFL